jgi:hypothetical protein
MSFPKILVSNFYFLHNLTSLSSETFLNIIFLSTRVY